MDTTECVRDGREKATLLSYRELACQCERCLLWIDGTRAECVEAALRERFEKDGAPLVLKRDNGSELKNELVDALLDEYHVVPLNSPPRRPEYNGSCEAGIGACKRRIAAYAEWNGIDQWTAADLEKLRDTSNQTRRPWGATGPTPEQRWESREPISDRLRDRFLASYQEARRELLAAERALVGETLSKRTVDEVERRAAVAALVRHGLVSFKRSRFTPPILTIKAAWIS